jgi:hypothetical protein
MSHDELLIIKDLVREQYLHRLTTMAPKQVKSFYLKEMSQYHQLSHLIEHESMWPKSARILGPSAVKQVMNLPFFQKLKKTFSIDSIATEEDCGWQEMYWRIVRPGNTDVGSLHADRWFWDLGHGTMPKNMHRLKLWIALDVDIGLSGLSVIPGSHLKSDWAYHGEVDHTGTSKPKFDEDISQLNIYDVPTKQGDFIVFHDDLIHGGMENSSNTTRVSIEATLLIPDSVEAKNLGKTG